MNRRMPVLLLAAVFLISGTLLAQFKPSGGSNPHSVVKKLSIDNFRAIKNLYFAIMNFGGGEAEFNRLVSGYASATSKYFAKEYDDSAAAFKLNDKDIIETGMAIAAKYKDSTSKMHTEIIEIHTKYTIKLSLDGKKADPALEKLLNEASESLAKANDFYIRKKPVKSIELYRRSKEKILLYYDAIKQPIPQEYEKDRKDNAHELYVSKEKEN